jgi:two-component system, chemotaxis family, protein-glutamate methylesterase/glutaminase
MRKIRVLIIDDAVVIRRLLTDIIGSDPVLEVAGAAATGSIGLAKIPQVNPDVITLDIEMPGLSGLETLAEIRKQYPVLPVIMFSTLTERGAGATLDALALGASDYVTKPSNVGSMTAGMQAVRESLVPKIKALCSRVLGGVSAPRPPVTAPRSGPAPVGGRVDVLAIGVSTGGPNALAALLPQLPGDLAVPIVIVQHMPPVFTKLLAQRLDKKSALRVAEGHDGARLAPGTAWIAPGDRHMEVVRAGVHVVLRTNGDPPENSCRPAVDPLFRSVATVYGKRSLALILTGMGQDGFRGSEHIHDAGGQILAQDEATSVVWGMPGAVAGLAERILPLEQLPLEIRRRVAVGRPAAPVPVAEVHA